MHVGRSATVTGHRIICNMHSSAVSPADTSYMEQMNVLSQQHLEQADRTVLLHQRVLQERSGILLFANGFLSPHTSGFFGRDLSQPCLGRGGAPIRRVRIGSAIVRSDMVRRQKGQWPWWACGNRLRHVPIGVQLLFSGHWLGHPNINTHYSHEVPQCGKAASDLDSTKSLPDICHVDSRNDGQQWRCVVRPRNCFPTPVSNRYRIFACLDWHLCHTRSTHDPRLHPYTHRETRIGLLLTNEWTPEVGGAVACPVRRFEIFGGPRRTNSLPATPGLQYLTIRD
ncbi:uncharacterized protein BO96DRAFT_467524 [Aspergillus niger CBS 101883]|uniref:Uncharacterized protein n=3 Tax=Aspergillus niger TaxID=5061 RepID=A5AB10_ASPNC|nr:uncharacterized protein BO96DRAFT_467524 [Aspergillus niger CBS 101883]XP_059606163.1 hypothetical protein An08g08640 [Aspergillus niger]PYH54636.1 hypothetical protein BO96DRAFT_467524 [Aspergillus niger CBS 101883]RDH18570.1 hypothetical protein M747DRAFT_354497 [Aspergillus niger ATCC 13496]CAK96644.1 hypothetical protein An08g08640 [Aspergillus niger]